MKLGFFSRRDVPEKEAHLKYPDEQGVWKFDEDDYLLLALLCDPIYASELMWEDPANHEYAGAYTVRDYQYPLFRGSPDAVRAAPYAGFACARTVGKTESVKARAFTHPFRRQRQNLLVTAPELIHLLPMTDAIEDKLRSVRLTRDFLDYRGGKTGFTHRPFGVDFADGTKIVGRIPRLTGTGVKGQHQPDLIIDEAQDYPEAGWIEVHERLSYETLVPTPTGWRTFGTLRQGGVVFGVDGRPTRIVGLSAEQELPTFRVRFDDGAEVVTDATHRWTVTCNRYLKDRKWLTRTTAEIAADLRKPGKAFGSPGQPWQLPEVRPVDYPHRELPLDPYTLGALLGDGSMRHGNLSLAVPAHKEPVRQRCVLARGDSWSTRRVGARCPSYGIVGGATIAILTTLGAYGLRSPDREIPCGYLTASIEQRLELLRGLVDTDGNVHRRGAIRYATSSDQLADDVCELVRSLGGRLSRSVQRNPRNPDGWQIFFRLPERLCPAARPDMVAKIRPSTSDKMRRRIVAVEPTGKVEKVRCIMVDSPDHLFLVEDYLPTRNTVMKDTVDIDGNPDFTYHFYGVHSGARDSGFAVRAGAGGFVMVQVTAIQRAGWGVEEKRAAKAAYGGTSSSDYRRNILGEPGSPASAFFVTARLMACVDQDRDSRYNVHEYVHQEIRHEELADLQMSIGEMLELPSGLKDVWGGMDVGLTDSPTVITLFNDEKVKSIARLKLYRRIHLLRFPAPEIRAALWAIGWHFGGALRGFGMDVTGLGLPMWQEMEADDAAPPVMRPVHRGGVARGYFFNAKVPVGVEKSLITDDGVGRLRDQYGAAVKEEFDPMTGLTRYVVMQPMIEASTRYLRDFVDRGYLMLPFDTDITRDFQGETHQRVKRLTGLKQKPNAFHILDSARGMAMVRMAAEVDEQLAGDVQVPVYDMAL